MSLLLAGLIAAGTSGAVIVGKWLARRRDGASQREGANGADANGADAKGADAKGAGEPKDGARGGEAKDGAKPEKRDAKSGARTGERRMTTQRDEHDDAPADLAGFPCQLGDVVMRMTGEEAWLAGGLVLSEDVPVAILFVAPDAGHDCAIYARPKPRDSLYWLEPLDPGAVLVGGEPPTSVEHAGVRFDRVRRLPLRPKRVGVGAPDVGDAVVVAEYASAGAERLLVVKSAGGPTARARAWRGVELEASSYEVIASGKKTLDD